MTLTPRGASDVPPTLDAFEKALRDYADAITNWSACTGGFVDVAAMRRHILESGALVVSMFDELTTRSAALEADKASLLNLTGCCVACGKPITVIAGPVNDTTCYRVHRSCDCNVDSHVWPASQPSPAERTRPVGLR